jgi:preprotein translocase subunit SecG
MSFIAGVLTVLLIVNCVLLILLVLVQLPKKDAGVGLAFGGGAADALFGAGSGNVLTKITKWGTGIFFAMSLILGLLEVKLHRGSTSEFEKQLQQQSQMPTAQPPVAPAPTAPTTATPATNNAPGLLLLPTNSAPPPAATATPSTPPAQPK